MDEPSDFEKMRLIDDPAEFESTFMPIPPPSRASSSDESAPKYRNV
jgi:hypothetical protein